ncbi:MAG: hypothetical protein OXJ55_18055, partial [Caldilineaceae bacterium]|nr:hypothetical protein [Caldilineaceae bacterium]
AQGLGRRRQPPRDIVSLRYALLPVGDGRQPLVKVGKDSGTRYRPLHALHLLAKLAQGLGRRRQPPRDIVSLRYALLPVGDGRQPLVKVGKDSGTRYRPLHALHLLAKLAQGLGRRRQPPRDIVSLRNALLAGDV